MPADTFRQFFLFAVGITAPGLTAYICRPGQVNGSGGTLFRTFDEGAEQDIMFIGAVAGVVVVFAVEFFDKVVKIDDPVGAISVHGVCGALGTLFTGIFGEGCSFIIQLIGFVAVAAYTLILAFILFFVLKKTIGLRVTEKEEIDGLDMHEHGCSAYANFHFHNDK